MNKLLKKILSRTSFTFQPNVINNSPISDDYDEVRAFYAADQSLYVQTALQRIKDAVSSVDLQLYEIINTKGETKRIEAHPILDLIYKPNPLQTKNEFFRIIITNLKLSNEAFIRVIKDEKGNPLYLTAINPIDISVELTEEGNLLYRFNTAQQGQIILTNEDMVHIKDPDTKNPLRGKGIISTIASRIQAEIASIEYQNSTFIKGNNPDGVLLYKGGNTLSPELASDIKRGWLNSFRGKNDSSRVAVVASDEVDFKTLTMNQKLDYIATQDKVRDDICIALGVPKSLITTDNVNKANAEAGLHQFLQYTIIPLINMILESLNERFVGKNYGEEFYLGYQKLLSEDKDLMVKELSFGVNVWLTVNEARARVGLDPIDGGDILQPKNSNPMQIPAQTQLTQNSLKVKGLFVGKSNLYKRFEIEEKTKKNMMINSYKSMVASPDFKIKYMKAVNQVQDNGVIMIKKEMKKFFTEQKNRVIENLKKDTGTLSAGDIFDIESEVEKSIKVIIPLYQKISVNAGNTALLPAKMFIKENLFTASSKLMKKLEARARFFAKSITNTTFGKIQEMVSNSMTDENFNLEAELSTTFNNMTESRAELIGRTESTYISNVGIQTAFEETPAIEGKIWFTSLDSKVRDEHQMNESQIVPKDEAFPDGEFAPGEDWNCRCTMAPIVNINNL